MKDAMLAGVELGGTKLFVLLARGRPILDREMIPTTNPIDTLDRAVAILQAWRAEEPFVAIGIGSFGPLRLDLQAADVGIMLPTPKPGWGGAGWEGRQLAPALRKSGRKIIGTSVAITPATNGSSTSR